MKPTTTKAVSYYLNQRVRRLTRRAIRHGVSISDSKRVVKKEIQRVKYLKRHTPRGVGVNAWGFECLAQKISNDAFSRLQEVCLRLVNKSKQAQPVQQQQACHMAVPRRRTRQRGESHRASVASGDSPADPEPERAPLQPQQLFSFTSAAKLLDCSPQTLRNKSCLGLIDAPIQTAVGPRFTQDQLRQITTLTPTKPIPADVVPPVRRRKAGRPRLASAAGKGGAA